MHEEVVLVHVALDEGLILLGVAAADYQVVLAGDEPDELLEPEDFTLDRPNLGLLQLFEVAGSCLFSLLDRRLGCIDRLDLLDVRLLANLEVLLDVELRRDSKIDVDSHHLVKVAQIVVIDLHRVLVGLIHGVQDQRDHVLLEIDFVDQVCELVVLLALLFDHALDVGPRDARANHHREDVDDGLRLESVLLEQQGFEI